MTVATLTKDLGFETYRIRADHEYATICLRAWPRGDHFCGEILIHSSFGNWAYQWGACANPFKRFLLGADFDYVFTKFMGTELRVFDGDASFRAIKRRVLAWRHRGDLDKEVAREAWNELADQREDAERSIYGFVDAMNDIVERVNRKRVQEMLHEPWDLAETRYDSGAVGFWREIWPHFVAQLRVELEQEAVPA